MKAKRLTPMRKVSCPDCGYTVRMARSWMTVGLPTCPCGEAMRPEAPADLAFLGLIGPDDMPAPMWTAICRENGWEDSIQRKGRAALSYNARMLESGGIRARRVAPAAQCSHPGCGRWVKHGEEHCTQHELAAMPF